VPQSTTLPKTVDADALLCRRAAGGDRRAFSLLVEAHEQKLRGFLAHLAGPDLAEELAQESFVKAWLSLPSFRGDSKFSSWICAIGWRCFIDHRRRERSEARKREAAALARPEAPPVGTNERFDLARALARLDPVERAVLVLCEGHGYSLSEAAAILSMPLGTLKGTSRRARRKCRAYLEGDGDD
jgi:RNA polymerase sigma-70 factor (ECF subfamily)